MSILIILILIPLLCITVSLFIMSLFNYVTMNELDIIMLSITMFFNLVLSFAIGHLIIKNNKDSSAYLLNLENRFLSVFGFYSFNIIVLFGIALVINSLLFSVNTFNVIIGLIIIIFYIWIFISYLIMNQNKVFNITVIDKINDHIDLIYLSDESGEYEFFVHHSKKYIEGSSYLCKYNKMSREVRKIIKEVIEVGNKDEQQ